MKIRTGFVSNSSSSSFVIACKGDLKEELKKLADESKTVDSPFNLSGVIDDMVDVFVSYSDMFDPNDEDFEEQLEYEYGWELDQFKEEYPDIYQKVKHFGWKLYFGSVSDQDYEPGVQVAVAMDIDYVGKNLIMKKDSYY